MRQVIPDDAVEAAAKALRKKFNGYEVERAWDSRDQRTTYRNDAIAALEAAVPHIIAGHFRELNLKAITHEIENPLQPRKRPDA